jgi:gas vesicle protein
MRHTTTPIAPLAFLGGTLFGLAVGATLGVFFAPAKGARTRRLLARKAEEIGDRATEMAETAREAVERGVERGRRFA